MMDVYFYTIENKLIAKKSLSHIPNIDDAIEVDNSQYIVFGKLFIFGNEFTPDRVNYLVRFMESK